MSKQADLGYAVPVQSTVEVCIYQQRPLVFVHDHDMEQSVVPQNLTEILHTNNNNRNVIYPFACIRPRLTFRPYIGLFT